jgi:hypothetical protein
MMMWGIAPTPLPDDIDIALSGVTRTPSIIVRVTSARCTCDFTACQCIDEARSLANALGYDPRRREAVWWEPEGAPPSEIRRQRASESLAIACRMQPLLREPQVIGHVPRRRLARGATPRRFAYYQGDAA